MACRAPNCAQPWYHALYHLAGIDRVFRRKRKQQRLVGREVIEHAEEKLRLARSRADRIGTDSGHRQEAAEPFGLAGDEAERGDGEMFRRRLRILTVCGLASLRHRNLRKVALGGRPESKPPLQSAIKGGAG